MRFIENEGALFRGPARAWPEEVWDGKAFKKYTGKVPKDIDWGNIIDEAEAKQMMGNKPVQQAAE